jgi:hypothetical protein
VNHFSLINHELIISGIHRNLPPSTLYEHGIRHEKDNSIAESDALVAYSGEKTGRSPIGKRIVENAASEKEVWWGPVNVLIDRRTYDIVRERAKDYLNTCNVRTCQGKFSFLGMRALINRLTVPPQKSLLISSVTTSNPAKKVRVQKSGRWLYSLNLLPECRARLANSGMDWREILRT